MLVGNIAQLLQKMYMLTMNPSFHCFREHDRDFLIARLREHSEITGMFVGYQ